MSWLKLEDQSQPKTTQTLAISKKGVRKLNYILPITKE